MTTEVITRTGRCLCGKTRYEFSGATNWVAHCHCESCRRNTASPFTTYLGVPNGAWRMTGQATGCYESSPGVRRLFCTTCGTPIAYDSDRFPHEIHFYLASLVDSSGLVPTTHVFYDEKVPWVELGDALEKRRGTSV